MNDADKSGEPVERDSKVEADRKLLADAQAKGRLATLGAYVRLSGPGWLQSAITLGGGSLAGALFLGALGGVNMLWLQLVAIIMGVVMLSAISYVTLSIQERPFQAINRHVNPALGWGWLVATSMANMIWCMPQFSLCYTSLNKNLMPGVIGDSDSWKLGVSTVLLVAVSIVVVMNARRGVGAKIFDLLLKTLVGMVVICFFGVVVYLSTKGLLDWSEILSGFIPDFSQWTSPTGQVAESLATRPASVQEFWSDYVVQQQRDRMIAAAATAVGINMTFLMPYSMLHRGWNKTFRGLARFDLGTGMAIPYVLVTSCVVIASAHAFHAKADDQFLSTNPAEFQKSPTFAGARKLLLARAEQKLGREAFNKRMAEFDGLDENTRQQKIEDFTAEMTATLPKEEKLIAASTIQRNAGQLSQTLAPLIGERTANFVFGLGVFGMGFSTIIILMLINGFVYCEATGKPEHRVPYAIGCLVAGLTGAVWPFVWKGDSQFWLAIVASTFGMMLLPIAYVTFFMMMNSRSILGKAKPTGLAMIVWNVLMLVSVLGALAAAGTAIYDKVTNKSNPLAGRIVFGMLIIYLILVAAGFFLKRRVSPENQPESKTS